MTWGRLELSATGSPDGDPIQQTVARKIGQLRKAQDAGQFAGMP